MKLINMFIYNFSARKQIQTGSSHPTNKNGIKREKGISCQFSKNEKG